LLGFAPLGAWLLFSTFYYGFPYPNTALAKLNEEFPRVYLVRQGLFFAGDLLVNDPVGFLTIAFGSVLTLKRLAGIVLRRTSRASMELASLGAGALLYSLYVVSIGGTYLSGRHWTLIIFVNAVLCAELLHTVAGRADALSERGDLGAVLSAAAARPAVRITAASGVLAALLILLGGPRIDLSSLGTYREIAKPSAFKFLANDYQWNSSLTAAVFEAKGRVFRESKFGVTSAVGLTAIAAGRDAIIIDRLALTDPRLARFPPRPQLAVLGMMDHFKREVPQGYKVARRSDTLEKMHPELRAYYEPLQRILRDPLFSAERLRTIVDFNLGRYDAHLDAYIEHRRKRGKSFMGSRP
jgi:arabinofuranosyltransferase